MATWVKNIIRILGTESDLKIIYDTICGEDFEFEKLVPSPDYLEEERLSNWKYANWGTRRGPHEQKLLFRAPDELLYEIHTANGSPLPVILSLSQKFPAVEVEMTSKAEGYDGKIEYCCRAGNLVKKTEYYDFIEDE